MKVTGIKEIDSKLAKLKPKVARKVLRKSMRAGMKDIQHEIRARFPKDTGQTAKTIKSRAGKGRRKDVVIDVRSDDDNYIVKFMEFGTTNPDGSVRIAARPTFRPVFDEMGEPVRLKTQNLILQGIEEVL